MAKTKTTKTEHRLTCHHCRAPFTARRRDARFCSNACRQAAHRAAHPADRSPAHRAEIAAARIAGKRATSYESYCRQCGARFWTDGTGTARLYCSNACRQARYRTRKSMATDPQV